MIELDKIYNEDCLTGMQRIPDGAVGLIVTDPPYVVTKIHNGGQMFSDKKAYGYYQQLDESGLCDGYDIEGFSREVRRLQGGKVNAYFWCNKRQIPQYMKTYVDGLHCKFEIICWHKQNALPTFSNKYLTDTEYCLYLHTGGFTHPRSYEDARTYDVSYINHEDKRRWQHPSIKPVTMIQRFIRNSSQEGGVVLDPFIGSGTTAIACIKEKRHFLGFELNKEYFDIAQRRIDECLRQPTLDFTDG